MQPLRHSHAKPQRTKREIAASFPRARFRHRPMTAPRLPPSPQERSSMRREAQADVARNEMSYAVLFADADGVVIETLAEPGQVVGAGQIVARVAHAGRREAIVELPETLRPSIGSTGHATLYGSRSRASRNFASLSDAANRHTRTFEARYVLRITGQCATGLDHLDPDSSWPLHCNAARTDRCRSSIVDPVPAYGSSRDKVSVTWRAVQIAALDDETVSVIGNLATGDRVVALGAHLLHEGDRVRLAASETVFSVAANNGAGR